MGTQDNQLTDQAIHWVKENQKQIVTHFAGQFEPAPEVPVSIFMAGSPGAGKTEFSKRLIEHFEDHSKYIIRIDPDEVREFIPCYVHGQAHLFQGAVSIAVEKIHDHALAKRKSFLLDGTFSNPVKARDNIKRSIDKNRAVLIEYVYQDPFVVWDFTQKREQIEGRNIPKEAFVDQLFLARDNVMMIKKEFGHHVILEVVTRNVRTSEYQYWFNVDNIDSYIKMGYSKNELMQKL